MRSDLQTVLLVAFFCLFFSVWGAGNLEGWMNYPFWRDMGAMMTNEEFKQLRADHHWKIVPSLVVPYAIFGLVTIALAIAPPPSIPRWAMLIIVALQLVSFTSTVFIQVPIQFHLSTHGYDLAALDRLITTNFWFRHLPHMAQVPLVIYLLWRAVASRTS